MPHNLLLDSARRRHEKAVDTTSGAIVGYARWILPESCKTESESKSAEKLWPEACLSPVDDRQAAQFDLEYAQADWNYNKATEPMDARVTAMKDRLKKQKDYMSK